MWSMSTCSSHTGGIGVDVALGPAASLLTTVSVLGNRWLQVRPAMVFAPLTRRNGLHAIGATVVDCMLGFCELALYVHLSLRPDVGAVLLALST